MNLDEIAEAAKMALYGKYNRVAQKGIEESWEDRYRRIAKLLIPYFGDPEPLDSVTFLPIAEWFRPLIPRVGYTAPPLLSSNGRAVLQFDQELENQGIQHDLDWVHEIYPGHHWERTRYRRQFTPWLGCLIYENYCFIEGWAKYVEGFYAEVVDTLDAKAVFHGGLRKAALLALAVLQIHGNQKGLNAFAQDLNSQGWVSLEVGQSIALSGYLNPLESIASFVGYSQIQRRISGMAEGTVKLRHVRLLNSGPSALWSDIG